MRLGVVSYLNAIPMVAGLDQDPAFELVRAVPAQVARLLQAGEVDLGLIPSIEYARNEGYVIAPGMAITSVGPVRSVLLFHRCPLDAVRTVALDTSSCSSVVLTRVLLRERLGRDPEYVERPPDLEAMLAEADAALVIGDVALESEDLAPRTDLGELWSAITGQPFVWAFWAGPAAALSDEVVARLQAALERGLVASDQLARAYHPGDEARGRRNADYLRHNIRYRLGPSETAGLSEYYRRSAALGLIPKAPEIRFHGHP